MTDRTEEINQVAQEIKNSPELTALYNDVVAEAEAVTKASDANPKGWSSSTELLASMFANFAAEDVPVKQSHTLILAEKDIHKATTEDVLQRMLAQFKEYRQPQVA